MYVASSPNKNAHRNLRPSFLNFHRSPAPDLMRTIDSMMRVQEMFFDVYVGDLQRAEAFYVTALGAIVDFASPTWSSLVIAGVRVNLVLREHESSPTGMHFIVENIALACAAVACAGGEIAPAVETSHGMIAQVLDTEGNTFTLRQLASATSASSLAASQAA